MLGMPAVAVVREFWRLMASNDFESVAAVLAPTFVLEWPQSKERIRGDEVGSEVDISDGVQRATAISLFSVEDGKIACLVEYWPEPCAARSDRAHLVETMS